MNIQLGQRWHYKDSCQETILEVTKLADFNYGNYDNYAYCKVIQNKKGSRPIGENALWNFAYGTWEYLEGQDATYNVCEYRSDCTLSGPA